MKAILVAALWLTLIVSCKKKDVVVDPMSAPVITSFNPASGGFNTKITIQGANFDPVTANNIVKINGIVATIESVSASSITAFVPERVGSGNIVVSNKFGVTEGGKFTYIPDVYVGGFEYMGHKGAAVYWKNGVKTVLSDTGTIYSISVLGTDIYAAGTSTFGTSNGYAVFWKNGLPTVLPTGNLKHGVIKSLLIAGNDIYASGMAMDTAHFTWRAIYWRNGVMKQLPDAGYNEEAISIALSGSDVYIASNINASVQYGRLWKNDVLIPLMTYQGLTTSMFVAGNDVYVSGFERIYYTIAKYWKNGLPFAITDGSIDARANALTISGTDLYITGVEGSKAKLWKNGVSVDLSDGTNEVFPGAIQVVGDDVYIAGVETIAGFDVPVIWKNGIKLKLTDGTRQARATSIFVQ